ncbi:MAG TPA: DEAD/DEAH box helicase, partial [Hyphomicrobiaceae bacterium]|nr:DEAD/DEAH box helicase [Hyphomicrobiaceae bacterium]
MANRQRKRKILQQEIHTPVVHGVAPLVSLPEPFASWFRGRGWQPRPHQMALLAACEERRSTLLIAPTGAGKTLAGFLPSLIRLSGKRPPKKGAGLKVLYVSPLKALAADVARNLTAPIAEMGFKIRTETRTGDTSVARKQRQRSRPPDILLTTPEQVALLLSHSDAPYLF